MSNENENVSQQEPESLGSILGGSVMRAALNGEADLTAEQDERRDAGKKANYKQHGKVLQEELDALRKKLNDEGVDEQTREELKDQHDQLMGELQAATERHVADNTQDDTFHPPN